MQFKPILKSGGYLALGMAEAWAGKTALKGASAWAAQGVTSMQNADIFLGSTLFGVAIFIACYEYNQFRNRPRGPRQDMSMSVVRPHLDI